MIRKEQDIIFESLKTYVKGTVFKRLPDNLYYHSPSHTFDDVLPNAILLANMERISQDDLFLLKVAVLFHDTGFIECYHKNESIGVSIAQKVLKSYAFPDTQIGLISNIIIATGLNGIDSDHIQSAGTNILEQIICDADLDNLGRDDFFDRSNNLRRELTFQGTIMSDNEWYTHQIEFLKSHHYYTKSAQSLRDSGKEKNLSLLRSKIRN